MPETGGAWPFIPSLCPRCRCFFGYEPNRADDAGYELPGFCRHPRIAMELFASRARQDSLGADCQMFVCGPV